MKRLMICGLVLAGSGALALAQQSAAPATPVNEQSVQFYRALLAEGGTQAVIQAVTAAVLEAMKQGPLTGEVGRAAIATAGASTASTPAPAAPLVVPKTWADSIVWKGDVRYRTELRQDVGKNGYGPGKDPNQNLEYDRLRARIGLEAQVNENVKAVVRLTTDGFGTGGEGTGSAVGGDPQSGNVDLNNGASKKGIYLDLAYLDWNFFGPDNSELHGLAGKMANPFITMNDDLVWDPDTTPEGLALKGQYDLSPVTLLGSAGYFVLNNQDKVNTRYNQTYMYGAQGAAKYEFCPEVSLTLGASYYNFNHIQGLGASTVNLITSTSTNGTFYGNDLNSDGTWRDGYTVIQPFASLDMFPTIYDRIVPVSVYAQGVDNIDAKNLSKGEMFGATLGKAKNPQTAEFGASWAKLERDSTLGMWTDSDRWGGGTDGEGYKLYLKYMILKNLAGQVTYFDDRKGIASGEGTGYQRWQFDLSASF